MTADHPYRLAALRRAAAVPHLAGIAGTLAAIAGCYAWAGGVFAPGRLDQARLVQTFESVNGVHPGFRRNHAKGACLQAYFDSTGAAAAYSKAQVFQPGRVPVSGRFALAGGVPAVSDGPTIVRSMALDFVLADGETWRTGMNDIPVFPVRDVQGFHEQLVAMRPDPTTGKPDPARLKAFTAAHPETARAQAIIRAHPFSSGFANSAYHGLNAFRLVDQAGRSHPVRWSMVPVDAFAPARTVPAGDPNYLFDDLAARLAQGPAQWHLVLTLGAPDDPTADATLPWPEDRPHVDAGTLTVTGVTGEAPGNCRDVNFDPLVLPSGIAPSDDPLLSARSAAYSVSFRRRAGEAKSPSAVRFGKVD